MAAGAGLAGWLVSVDSGGSAGARSGTRDGAPRSIPSIAMGEKGEKIGEKNCLLGLPAERAGQPGTRADSVADWWRRDYVEVFPMAGQLLIHVF